MQRTFSPPESTLALFLASSPLNNMRPRKPRMKFSSGFFEYCRSQSTRFRLVSKNAVLSFGK